MNTEPLVQPFPMPSERIRIAYWDLHLSEEGTGPQQKRLGRADLLARPWDIATCTDPDLRRDVWEWYEAVATWFNHEYVWDPTAGMIPPCWPQHPHLIHDIGVLADQRRLIALATTSNALEEWHRYSVPAFSSSGSTTGSSSTATTTTKRGPREPVTPVTRPTKQQGGDESRGTSRTRWRRLDPNSAGPICNSWTRNLGGQSTPQRVKCIDEDEAKFCFSPH